MDLSKQQRIYKKKHLRIRLIGSFQCCKKQETSRTNRKSRNKIKTKTTHPEHLAYSCSQHSKSITLTRAYKVQPQQDQPDLHNPLTRN